MAPNKRVIVLGSNGFIGAHLVSRLRDQGYYVAGIDRLPRSDPSLALGAPDSFYQLSLPDRRFAEILREIRPEVIINASGPASVANSLLDPGMDFDGSVNLCFFVLESLRKVAADCRFMLVSSAAVYGNTSVLPVSEDTPLNPISPYGYHKVMCELLAREYHSIYGIQTSVIRIFSAYGPGLRKQILWDMYQKALKDNLISLFGSGEETRDFVFVKDIAQAIQLVLEKGVYDGTPYNIGSGVEVSIRKLAELFLSCLGVENRRLVFSGESKPGDPSRWCADIGQLKNLGFFPGTHLDQGLLEYARWVKALKGN